MNACASDEVLEQLLRGALPEERAQPLREHLAGCALCRSILDRLADDPALRHHAAAYGPPEAHEPELARRLEQLRRMPLLEQDRSGTPTVPTGAALPSLAPPEYEGDLGTLGPYRILKELGRGGMGVVLLAHDKELERLVAVKVLRPDRSDEAARARFVREARAAASIEHDHVVPVYAVASPADGPPYLVMQYVEGPTLQERIRSEKRLDPKEAARIGRQAAEGLAAAHCAGLIHRDIKPGNILLDKVTGRARIMDFGLVRITALPSGTTQEGTILGTPEYMSPEQVRQPDRIDARSDVYSLGVTLYEALTGEAPFRGVPHLVLQQVLHDEPRPPRRLNDQIPRDLETICLKAMAKEPARRYPTAQELGDDLGRWLNGEPIRARPVGVVGRVGRWCRRRPAVAGLAVLLVLAVLGGFVGVTWQLWRVEQQRRQTEEQRQRAEANFELAEKAVNTYLNAVTNDPQLNEHALRDLRRLLLRSAMPFYQELVKQQPTELRLQQQRAKAYLRLGFITNELGSRDQAIEQYRQAQAILGELASSHPDVTDFRVGLASSHNDLGNVYRAAGRLQEARQAYEDARALFTVLAGDHPSDPEYRRGLANSHGNLGILYGDTGRLSDAEQALRTTLEFEKALGADYPSVPRYAVNLANTYINLSFLYKKNNRLDEARQACLDALAVLEALVKEHPSASQYAVDHAKVQARLGNLLQGGGKPEEGVDWYAQAIATLQAVLDKQPSHRIARQLLCQFHQERASILTRLERYAEALRNWDQALSFDEGRSRIAIRLQRALTLARGGNHAAAVAEAQALSEIKGPPASGLYNLACVFALSAAAAGDDAKLVERYAARAVELLRQAVAQGYKNGDYMRKDADLKPLQSRDDFQKLLRELERTP